MTTTMITIGIAILAVLIAIAIHNFIIGRYNAVERGWADVIAYQRRTDKTIPALIEAVKDYEVYEKELQAKITELRTSLAKLSPTDINTDELQKVEQKTMAMMKSLSVAVEAYPDLKAATPVTKLMNEISEVQANVAAAITIFNGNVAAFNNSIQMFPNSLINATFTKKTPVKPFHDSVAQNSFEYSL